MTTKPAPKNVTDRHDAGPRARRSAIRPPKAIYEKLFVETCDGCGDCIAACETGILVGDHAGRPIIDFDQAECTFCGACASACPTLAFDISRSRDWMVTARISDGCLNVREVVCRLCLETCEQAAIRFVPQMSGAFMPIVIDEMCNGCGACVSTCPEGALIAEGLE